jgi:glycine cleavage system H protein
MKLDENARYSETHEWVRPEGDLLVYGITDHAQELLSDIVYVELPETGTSFKKGDRLGSLESVKAASDLYLPIAGTVVELNGALSGTPELLNSDPFGQGWIAKVKPADAAELEQLLTPAAYAQSIGG